MAREGVDVLVIGGGITGAGVALDAVTRGYRVGLVEKRDFASGTSSWSTKLVHGGIRYLPEGDVPLVREALVERGRLLANAPHLVHPLAFVLPLYGWSRHPVGLPIAPPAGIGLDFILDTGLTIYDVLAGRENIARHRRIDRDEVLRRAACLRPADLRSGFIYDDAQTDDARLTLTVLRTAADAGAYVANYATVVGFDRGPDGQVRAAHVRVDAGTAAARALTIAARFFVNATGVYAEQVEELIGESPRLSIEPSKGVHLVVTREALDIGDDAVVLPETADRRVIFLVPWRSRVLIGTTDTGSGDLDHPRANAADVDYLLGHVNRSVTHPLAPSDIISTFAGYRPLLRLRHTRTPARLSRSHAVVRGTSGLISVSGGKMTTYRVMARDVMNRITELEGTGRRCKTAGYRLLGATGWPGAAEALTARGAALGLGPDVIAHLGMGYGSLADEVLNLVAGNAALGQRVVPDLPTIAAEIVYAGQAELALTVADALGRRTRLALEAHGHAVAAAPRVAVLLGDALGWDAERRARELADYADYIALLDAGIPDRQTNSPLTSTEPASPQRPTP